MKLVTYYNSESGWWGNSNIIIYGSYFVSTFLKEHQYNSLVKYNTQYIQSKAINS